MPDKWRERVRAKIGVPGRSLASVAKELGVDPANVLRMIRPLAEGGYRSSAHAVRLGEIVGEPLPGVPSDEEESAADLLNKLHLLSPSAHAEWVRDLRRTVDDQEKLIARARNRRRRHSIPGT